METDDNDDNDDNDNDDDDDDDDDYQDGGADLTIMMRREAYDASRLQVKAGHKTIAYDEAQSYTDADVK